VPTELVVETAKENGVELVGLSALMTTTVNSMAETIDKLHAEYPECKIAVGGAVLNEEYAAAIGADKYCKDAMETVRYAESLEKLLN
jgi:5-methyltetrahydrofolate--homocysteine methyltransferase